ncbi:MAG: hypothetical protein GX802_00495 [Clostridiales bacterium]|nr:hypothetical protein [Clostridiales bacterium]
MANSDSLELGCVCPECLNRCNACLGTNSVKNIDDIKAIYETFIVKDNEDKSTLE